MLYKKLLITILATPIFLAATSALAQVSDNNLPIISEKNLTFVARDANGNFIPNINFAVYTQGVNADGYPAPLKSVTSGKTDAILGSKKVTFKSDQSIFVLKAWQNNPNVGAFWFYNVSIDGDVLMEKTLGGVKIALRDTEGNLLRNANYSIYEENYDFDNNPIKEKKELVSAFNTGETGGNDIYLADDTLSINGKNGGYYIFEMSNKGTDGYIKYNIKLESGRMELLNFTLSDLRLSFRKDNSNLYSSGAIVSLFKQIYDSANMPLAGSLVASEKTDDRGSAVFRVPEGFYVAKVVNESGDSKLFYDIEVLDQKRTVKDYVLDQDFDIKSALCKDKSLAKFSFYGPDGKVASDIGYELYEEDVNADGKPVVGVSVLKGNTGKTGISDANINPDQTKNYALKAYQKNSDVGEHWFFGITFSCGIDKEIAEKLSRLKVRIYDSKGELLRDQAFALYEQGWDDSGAVLEKKIVGSFTTGKEGKLEYYLSPKHPYDASKSGIYILKMTRGGVEFRKEGIRIGVAEDRDVVVKPGALALSVRRADNSYLGGREISIFSQRYSSGGERMIGDKPLIKAKTDQVGKYVTELSDGDYTIAHKDDLGQMNYYGDIVIREGVVLDKTIRNGIAKVSIGDAGGKAAKISIFAMDKGGDGRYRKGKSLMSIKSVKGGDFSFSAKEGPYLISFFIGKDEYYKNVQLADSEVRSFALTGALKYKGDESFHFPKVPGRMAEKMKGRVLLQVEKNGEAWYVDMVDKEKHYLKDGSAAYALLRRYGTGIRNKDLEKFEIGTDSRLGEDSDADGLIDALEEAIGTDPKNADTDKDGFVDGEEVERGFNPRGHGKMTIDKVFAKKNAGKIFIQTEKRGEAWYVNPADNKRYYMRDGDAAFRIMRFLSVGIKNADLEMIK